MTTLSTTRLLPSLLVPLLLGACATPSVLDGDFATITPQQAATTDSVAVSPVRWGGTILSADNTPEQSCFEVLSAPLDYNARPQRIDQEQGRFLACQAGFKDPELYKPGREITVTGAVNGVEARKVGEFDYRYPKVTADQIYLWPERRETSTTYVVDPFFYPYPYFYYYPHYRSYSYRPGPIPPDHGDAPPRRQMEIPPQSRGGEGLAPQLSGRLLSN